MELRIKPGAVVAFTLIRPENTHVCGRVQKIYDDEVVVFPQKYVAKEECPYHTGRINTTITVDEGPEIHVNRDLIALWRYASMPAEGNYAHIVSPSEITEQTVVSHYGADGFCRGEGYNPESCFK